VAVTLYHDVDHPSVLYVPLGAPDPPAGSGLSDSMKEG
jgi:hypothetical protein